jgi:urease accessory protein
LRQATCNFSDKNQHYFFISSKVEQMKNTSPLAYVLSLIIFFMPVVVEAHPFHWATQSIGFTSGFFHQLTEIDHILLLIAIGLGFPKSGIKVPAGMLSLFSVLMLTGGGLSFISFDINGVQNVEEIKALSSLLLLALGCKVFLLPKRMFIVGTLALFHGYTHSYDMLLDTDATSFTFGYVISTTVLILSGIILKWLFNRCVTASHYFEQHG